MAGIFVHLGVQKIRLTGGEPLMRRGLERLVEMLAGLPVDDLALTTNGSFPIHHIKSLKDAGLKRMTVSLDSLDDEVFKAMNDVDYPATRVLEWIEAASAAGFNPIKINMVVKKGVNEDSILPMARYFHGSGHIVRFIEFMDVGTTNGWRMDEVVPAADIIARINRELPIEPVQPDYPGEVARRYRYLDGGGEIGIIASVTQAFCRDCTRVRISADGKLYTCLFASQGFDLRQLLRNGETDESIASAIRDLWQKRIDRYSEIRSSHTANLPKVEMSYIGG